MLTVLLFATFTMLHQLPTGALALQPTPSLTEFTFVVAGDDRPAKASDGLTTPFHDIVTTIAKTPPAFVVWNGDSVYGKQHKGVKEQYAQFLGVFASLPVPVFNAPGNHELVTNITCGKDTGEFPSSTMLDAYQKAMAAPYGMFRYGNAAFVLVNTDDLLDVPLKNHCAYNGYVSTAQLAALTDTLAALDGDSSVTHIFLFMHRPIHDDDSHQIGTTKSNAYGQQVEAFRHSIDHGGYKKLLFVFASHDHRLYVFPARASLSATSPGNGGEPAFLVTGGAGAPLAGCKKGGTGKPGAYYHYLSVSVNGGNVTITPVPLYGTTTCTQPPS